MDGCCGGGRSTKSLAAALNHVFPLSFMPLYSRLFLSISGRTGFAQHHIQHGVCILRRSVRHKTKTNFVKVVGPIHTNQEIDFDRYCRLWIILHLLFSVGVLLLLRLRGRGRILAGRLLLPGQRGARRSLLLRTTQPQVFPIKPG